MAWRLLYSMVVNGRKEVMEGVAREWLSPPAGPCPVGRHPSLLTSLLLGLLAYAATVPLPPGCLLAESFFVKVMCEMEAQYLDQDAWQCFLCYLVALSE